MRADDVAGFYNAAYVNVDTLRSFRSYPSSSWRHSNRGSYRYAPSQAPTILIPTYIRDYKNAADLNSKRASAPALDDNANGRPASGVASDFDPYSRMYQNGTQGASQATHNADTVRNTTRSEMSAENPDDEEYPYAKLSRTSNRTMGDGSTIGRKEPGGSSARPEEQLMYPSGSLGLRSNLSVSLQ